MDYYSSKLAFEFESARIKIYGMKTEVFNQEDGTVEEIVLEGVNIEENMFLAQYYSASATAYFNILDALEELIIVEKLLLNLPDDHLAALSIPTAKYLSFQYKSWVIKIVTTTECYYNLINTVFDLGIDKRSVGAKIVSQNHHVTRSKELKKKLRLIDKFLQKKILEAEQSEKKELRNIRNEIIHRGEFSHSLISALSRELLGERFNIKDLSHDDLINLKIEKHKISINIGKDIKVNNQEFINLIIGACDLLAIEFQHRFEKFLADLPPH